jgi:hypothetical protein
MSYILEYKYRYDISKQCSYSDHGPAADMYYERRNNTDISNSALIYYIMYFARKRASSVTPEVMGPPILRASVGGDGDRLIMIRE